MNKINNSLLVQYEHIFGTLDEQIEVMKIFSKIEQLRNHIMKRHVLPGGQHCQDPCIFGYTLNGAADIFSS